jgi:hypothetical protein
MPTPSLADTLYHWSLRQQIYEADRRQTLQREREEWLSYKAQRLASLIDYEHDEMWVLKGFEKLKGGPVLGNGSCAQLPQIHGSVPLTKFWKPGPKIHGNEVIIPYGTAIATFVNGVYPNWEHGNHAAIFGRGWSGHLDGKLTSEIVIFDQWKGKSPDWRFVAYGDGVSDRSNDGAAFSVIVTAKPMWPTGMRIPVRY